MSTHDPLVTIILPTFNRRAFLPAAIQSIHDQTFKDWRLLVVNDGGEDVSDVVSSFGDSRIEWHDRPHLGKAAALNHGLGLVRSKYIAYMDDDDALLPEHFSKLVAAAEQNGAEFVYSDTWLIRIAPDGTEIRRDVENAEDVSFEDIRIFNRINHKQILHTKRLADEVGPYDERLRILIDYDYVRRLAQRAHPLHVREITGEHFLRLASDNPNDFASISGLWISDPAACGRSVAALFEKDPAALADVYRCATRVKGLELNLAKAREAAAILRNEWKKDRISRKKESDRLRADLHRTRVALKSARTALASGKRKLRAVESSRSYRLGCILTAPFRWPVEFFRGLRRGRSSKKRPAEKKDSVAKDGKRSPRFPCPAPSRPDELAGRFFRDCEERSGGNPETFAHLVAGGFGKFLDDGFRTLSETRAPAEAADGFVASVLGSLKRVPARDVLAKDPPFSDYASWLEVPDPPPRDIVVRFARTLRARQPAQGGGVAKPGIEEFRRSFSFGKRILQRLGASLCVVRAILAAACKSPVSAGKMALDLRRVARSGLFDRDFYVWEHPETAGRFAASPLLHYCTAGWKAGWRPSSALPSFPPRFRPAPENPVLLHLRLFGRRKPSTDTIRKLLRLFRPDLAKTLRQGRLAAEREHPKIAVVVPVYDHPELLPPLVASLLEHTPPDVLLLFVENGSRDPDVKPMLERLAAACPDRVRVEFLAENAGFSGACNHGIRAAGRRDVILLNNDTVVGPRWTDSLRLAAYAERKIGSATAVSDNSGIASVPDRGKNPMPPGRSVATTARGWLHAPETYYDMHTGHGFCLYLRREMLDEIGGFDADAFGKGYGEEADLCLRGLHKGWKHRITTKAFVWHLNAVSFGSLYKSFKVHVARHILLTRHPDLDALEAEHLPRWKAFCSLLRTFDDDTRGPENTPRPRILFLAAGEENGRRVRDEAFLAEIRPEFEPFLLGRAGRRSVLRNLSGRAVRENGPDGLVAERGRATDDDLVCWIVEHGIELVHAVGGKGLSAGLRKRLSALHVPVLKDPLPPETPDRDSRRRAAARLCDKFASALSFAPDLSGMHPFARPAEKRDLLLAEKASSSDFDPATFDRCDFSGVATATLDGFPLPLADDARLMLLVRLCGTRLRINARTEDTHFWRGRGSTHFRLLSSADHVVKPTRPMLDSEWFPVFPPPYVPPPAQAMRQRVAEYLREKERRNAPARMVVYTAIAGGYEALKLPETPDPDVDYVYFAPRRAPEEGPWTHRPFAWTDEDPTRTARWHKLHGCDLFPDAETVVWIDGNITLRAGVEREIRERFLAGGRPFASLRHFDRTNVFDEVEACIELGKDDPGALRAQALRYRAAGLPDKHPFAETSIVAFRPADPVAKTVFATWWDELAAGSRRDQISFPFALWKNGADFTPLFDRDIRYETGKVAFAAHEPRKDPGPRVHARQFVLSRRRFDRHGFRHLELPDGIVLSYDRDLRVRATPDRRTVLIGLAWSCDPAAEDPLAAAAACGTERELERVLDAWSGRWILLRDGRLRMDACGLLGVFFRGGDCSSSLALLGEHLGLRPRRPGLKHQFGGMDFYPGPLTPQPGVSRLLPGQGLDLAAGSPFERPPEPPAPAFGSEDERIAAVVDAFDVLLRRIAADYPGRVRLPLTAGYDSRTLAALLEHAGVEFETFTMDHRRLRIGDRDLPPRLAARIGRRHRFVPRTGSPDSARYRIYDEHCAGLAVDEDRNFFAFRQYPEPKDPSRRVAVLRGGVWESVREYYREKHKLFRAASDLSEFKAAFLNVRYRPDLQRAFGAWLDHCRSVPSPLDPVDRYYLEQRAGAWLSSVEQSLDIVPGMDSIHPCNCRRIVSLLRSFPREDRIACRHQAAIVRAACPALLGPPFQGDASFAHGRPDAPPSSPFALLARRMAALRTCVRCLGLRGTIRFLLDRWK